MPLLPRFLSLVVLLPTLTGPVCAETDPLFLRSFTDALYSGQTEEAVAVAKSRLATATADRDARFALGVAEFLRAAEGLSQGLHHYGLDTRRLRASGADFGLAEMPFLRTPVPVNPDPAPVTYEGLRAILDQFVNDLTLANQTLGSVGPGPVLLPLDLAAIRLDMNGDGHGSQEEGFMYLVNATMGPVAPPGGAVVHLDESDVHWLAGYANELMAVSEVLLAHDWRGVFDGTFQFLFPATEFPASELAREAEGMQELLATTKAPPDFEYALDSIPEDPKEQDEWWEERDKAHGAWLESPEGQAYTEYRSMMDAVMYGGIGDLIAFVHLFHWPVVEPDRLQSSRQHLLGMIAESRAAWTMIPQETDNDHEWAPGPTQTPVFDMEPYTQQENDDWLAFLDSFESVLNGDLLVPHWRIGRDRGINVRRMFEDPDTFDPVLILQGSAVLPYLETGPLVPYSSFLGYLGVF
ncbi:MAG: hypothetical protein NTX73_18140 [Rhodobacterales bacterium]|nr:hypothetical protein [Rhodobacterales bacterium]